MNEVINRLIDDLNKYHQQNIEYIKKESQIKHAYKSTETKDLFTALSKAQGEMPLASLNASNPYFKTRYTDLAEIVRVTRPYLSKYGLSVTQQLITNEDGGNVLVTTLAHSSGQYIESVVRIVPPKSDIQTLGSYMTYLRRYCLASLLCVASGDEDDDAETVMADQRETFAKGPAEVKYEQKKLPYETVSREQLLELEIELADHPDIAEEVLDKLQIQSLADMKKALYPSAIKRIREIKQARASVSK